MIYQNRKSVQQRCG